jgi:hypothetical protein
VVNGDFAARGWLRFPPEPATLRWAGAALPLARAALAGAADWRCGGTWSVGLDALPNDARGGVGGVPLAGAAVMFVRRAFGPMPLHRAQLSTTRPGYPQPSAEESAAAFGYRLNRDAAHVDGLLPIGPDRRRMIREPHAFILGVALTEADPDAAPLTVWDGSHRIMGAAFRAALAPRDPAAWADIDVTEPYQAARREVFATCRRHTLPLRPGEAVVMHRHLLHGVAPWAEGALAAPEGRVIAYFRPELASAAGWAATG